MVGHIQFFAKIKQLLLTTIRSQDMSATLHVMLQSKKASIRVVLDVWDFNPCNGMHECYPLFGASGEGLRKDFVLGYVRQATALTA